MSPKATLPPPVASQPRHQSLPTIDPRLGFLAPHPPFTPSSPAPRRMVPAQPTSELPHTTYYPPPQLFAATLPGPSPSVYTPLPTTGPDPVPSESESDGGDADGAQNHEPDIDERSDDEDDRAAHELLRAVPMAARDVTNPLTILPYDHQGFAVSSYMRVSLFLPKLIL